ncbi:glycosyltransferase family 2 protein [Cellulosimicrobium cellulans]|nr:glycosyltransferase family 2 protein [Cellulosimicrobium cellulans]
MVVVSYGSAALLERNLGARGAVGEARVLVVDNRSTTPERERVSRLADERGWDLLAPAENLGFGGGANLGMRAAFDAGADEVLLLNPDATIAAADVRTLRAAVQDDRLLLVSPVVLTPAGRRWFGGLDVYLDDGTFRAPSRRDEHPGAARVEWLSGACLLVTREVWERTGGFDDAYFLYWEDVDLSYRLQRAGGRVAVVEDAVAVHDEGGTHRDGRQRPEAKSETYYYYNIRNRMLFAAQHLDEVSVRRWRRSAPGNARAVLRRGGRRQFLRPVVPLRAAWRGRTAQTSVRTPSTPTARASTSETAMSTTCTVRKRVARPSASRERGSLAMRWRKRGQMSRFQAAVTSRTTDQTTGISTSRACQEASGASGEAAAGRVWDPAHRRGREVRLTSLVVDALAGPPFRPGSRASQRSRRCPSRPSSPRTRTSSR